VFMAASLLGSCILWIWNEAGLMPPIIYCKYIGFVNVVDIYTVIKSPMLIAMLCIVVATYTWN